MNEIELDQLSDIAMRRQLSPEEKARVQSLIANNPSLREVWDEEQALSRLIGGLPDAPVASNFTRQVLDAAARIKRGPRHRPAFFLHWLGLRRTAQQIAAACAVLLLATVAYFQYHEVSRDRMALALSNVAPNMELPSEFVELAPAELWQNYDAIQRLGQTASPADEELLSALPDIAMK